MFDLTQSCLIECFLSQLYYYFFHIFVIFSWRESFLLLLFLIFGVAYFLESIFVHMSLKSLIGFLLLGVNIYLLSASWLYFVLLFGGFHFRYTLKERGFIWLTRSSHFTLNFTPNLVLAYPWNATAALIIVITTYSLETRAEPAVLRTYVENQAILEPILLYRASKCKQTKEQGSEDCLWTHIFTFL